MAASNPIVERFKAGDVPEPLKAAAARGALPLPPEELVEILFHLRKEPSKEIQQDIVRTIEALPLEPVLQVAGSVEAGPAMLDFLARANFRRQPVLEKVLLNPATGDATFHLLAQHGSESILDLIALSQVRLTRSPVIVQAMLANPRTTITIRRRLKEIWDLHQQELADQAQRAKAAPQVAAAPAAEPASALAVPEPVAEPVEAAPPDGAVSAEDPAAAGDAGNLDDLGALGLDQRILEAMQADEATEEELRLAQKLLTMSVPEKVQLALKGSREARMVLIRDSNKLVQEGVINSPKLTENEVEKIANMRSMGEDVLRMISHHREFTKSYAVVHNLVRNPKTPQPVAMQLMNRLQNRDLQLIGKDKNISDTIRRHAAITLEKRQPKKGPTMKKH